MMSVNYIVGIDAGFVAVVFADDFCISVVGLMYEVVIMLYISRSLSQVTGSEFF